MNNAMTYNIRMILNLLFKNDNVSKHTQCALLTNKQTHKQMGYSLQATPLLFLFHHRGPTHCVLPFHKNKEKYIWVTVTPALVAISVVADTKFV